MRYVFSDTEMAAKRLKFLNKVFSPSTSLFLNNANVGRIKQALDLGCGPGFTTQLMERILRCEKIVGLDMSEKFINSAGSFTNNRLSFQLHDVALVPFPINHSDLIYCRFLLTHLSERREIILNWLSQLKPGGYLLIEEVEWIYTENKVFKSYLNIVETMLDHNHQKLYVGEMLDNLEFPGNILEKVSSQVQRLEVSNEDAATMFFLNIQNWKDNSFVTENYFDDYIDRLISQLYELKQNASQKREIEWGLRQIIYKRI